MKDVKKIKGLDILIFILESIRLFSVIYFIMYVSKKIDIFNMMDHKLIFSVSIIISLIIGGILSFGGSKKIKTKVSRWILIGLEAIKGYTFFFLLDVIFTNEFRLAEFSSIKRIFLNLVFLGICIYLGKIIYEKEENNLIG